MREINICHLYGNLLNSYGDIGNVMAFAHECHKNGFMTKTEIISLNQKFDADKYDFVFFGGGQDYEQKIVQEDLYSKKDQLIKYIENDGLLLAICGGYQLLGQYYYDAYENKIEGLKIFDHYTINQKDQKRFTGDIEIKDLLTGDTYKGFENHGGMTFLADNQEAFGRVISGNGNNGDDKTEGFRYKNTIGSYLHGPLLARNENLARNFLKLFKEKDY